MPLYEYQAFNAQGKSASGLIDAPSRTLAYERVRAQGLFPSKIQEEGRGDKQGRSSPENVAFALIQLATLIRAGVPLPQAIDSLVSAVPDRALQRGLARVRVKLQEGSSFAAALEEAPVFGNLLSKLVSAGESVGTLDVLLDEYARFLERGQEFRQKVSGAMIYPMVIMCACLALIFFVLTHVTPTLTRIYSSFHMQMPWTTNVLLAVGNLLRQGLLPGIVLVALLGFALMRLASPIFRDRLVLRIPVVGLVHQYTQIARWARTVALLQKGGVPLVRALKSAREVVESPVLASQLSRVEGAVERGDALGASLRKLPLVPPLVTQMVETGEKSGELDSLLVAAALFYEKEADRRLSTFVRLLEPAMILMMGVVVGFIVFSVLMPIFEINRMVH